MTDSSTAPTRTPAIFTARSTAGNDRDLVLFRIGMRFNGWRGVATALRVFFKMPLMLAELEREPALGLLSSRVALSWPVVEITQFWRSFDDLERYAAAPDHRHRPAWSWFNRLGKTSRGAGIWHETYRIGAGAYESIYVNMPVFGLAKAIGHRPVRPHETRAKMRIGAASAPSARAAAVLTR